MSNFEFKYHFDRIQQLCKEALEIINPCQDSEVKLLVANFENFLAEYQKQTKLTIAFIGQYNAGKSTLIKALTGDSTVRISAEICTDNVTEYVWREVLLVDTPGIYAGRIDHDQKTLDTITKCDLLVFVVPNELFNPQGGAFFRKVANEMQRVGQMVLVINKMSRERGKPEGLLKTILEVIEPNHPNDFYICFIDADSYLKAQSEEDDEEKQFLLEESNFDILFTSLQKLVKKNEFSARLVTPLHRAVDLLEQSRNIVTTDEKPIRGLLEILRRKTLLIRASRTRFQNDYRSELDRLEHEIMMLGERVASKVDGRHGEEEINLTLKKAEQEIELTSRKVLEQIQTVLQQELNKLQAQLEELMQSRLGRSLAEEFVVQSEGSKQVDYQESGRASGTSTFFRNSPEVIKGISRFASAVSRDLVYSVGKFFGVKFKPWGAVNGAKFIRGLGPIIAGVGTILDIFMAAKEEKDEADYEQQLREARADIRGNFRKAAFEMRNEYEENIKKEILIFYAQEIQDIELQQSQLRNTEKSKVDLLRQIEDKLREIKEEIYSLG